MLRVVQNFQLTNDIYVSSHFDLHATSWAIYNHWTRLVDWTGRLVDWTRGLTLKIILPSDETNMPVVLHDASCIYSP